MYAAWNGHIEVVTYLLNLKNANIDLQNSVCLRFLFLFCFVCISAKMIGNRRQSDHCTEI